MAGTFFGLLIGDLPLRLMLGVAKQPRAREMKQRAERAAEAVLALHGT